jgi:hypothetical protein
MEQHELKALAIELAAAIPPEEVARDWESASCFIDQAMSILDLIVRSQYEYPSNYNDVKNTCNVVWGVLREANKALGEFRISPP